MIDNPYTPPTDYEINKRPIGLHCPYCSHLYRLTWWLYLTRPFGKHRCPACGKLAKLRATWWNHLAMGLITAGGALICFLLSLRLFGGIGFVGFWIPLVLFFAAVFVVDRWRDERRELDPLD